MSNRQEEKQTKRQGTKSGRSLFWRFLKGTNVYDTELEDLSLQAPSKLILKKLMSNKLAIIGIICFVSVLLLSFMGSFFLPLNENYIELTHANIRPGTNYLDFPEELENKEIKKISSGISFSAAVTTEGEFYLWGTEPNKEQKNVSGYIFDIPQEVYENKIVDVACGGNHVFVVDENGNFYGWGYNGNGQLDMPEDVQRAFLNPRVEVVQMEAKSQWTAVLGSDGILYFWGSPQVKMNFLISSRIQGDIVKFAGGDTNLALLLEDGSVNVIGDRGSEFFMNLPTEFSENSTKIVDITATNKNVLALDEDGKIHTWGSVQDELLNVPQIENEVISINSGYRNFLAVDVKNELFVWGSDTYSQLDFNGNLSENDSVFADYYQFYIAEEDGKITAFGNEGFAFGTDQFGRDIFTRIVHGGRISLTVGAIAVVISVIIALFVGLTAGYFGGIVDQILMRVADVFSSIPFYPIAITLSYVIGFEMSQEHKLYLIMVILGLLGWMSLARLIRAQLLLEREKDFVLAARALGIKNRAIMWRHILPNVFNLVIVNITLGYGASLLSEAALSFLGFGVAEPTPSWGNMLTAAQDIAVIEFYWWRWLIPALFVMFTALSVNLVGDALRDAMDPRSNEK